MKISCNWLRDYIDTGLSPEEIAVKITLTGLEVEEIEKTGSDFEGIIVGEVLETKPHPNADRLTLCNVNTGDAEVQIVCGAPNVADGQKVPVATVGTVLPVPMEDGSFLKIRKSKIRGEVSFGMICAEDELGIGDDHSGIMVLDAALKPGTPFAEVTDVKPDHVFEVGLTPNRPDAACHVGVARDLAAAIKSDLLEPETGDPEKTDAGTGHPSVKISIKDTGSCHRYVGIVMRGITVEPSPDEVQQRLRAIGLRPRNNIVDATNYVLHELGQPLHAFDLNKLNGPEIIVQSFDKEVEFETLDDQKRKVPAGSLFICDAKEPVAVAGVMGGLNTEITDDTKDILIESAWFDPVSVRKTSKLLALQTDSSYRFERGVDPELTLRAAMRCAELIQEWSGGDIEQPVIDVHPVKPEPVRIELRPERVNAVLGTKLETSEMVGILDRLGFDCAENKGVIHTNVPGFRPDVKLEIDLIEEIARIYDYNKIETKGRITFPRPGALPFEEEFNRNVATICTRLGLQEIYTNSLLPGKFAPLFADESELIPTMNPISRDQAIMRPSLAHGFLRTAAWNFNRKIQGISVFETGHVFKKGKGRYIEGVNEYNALMIGLSGLRDTEHWITEPKPWTIFDLKSRVNAFLTELRLDKRIQSEQANDKILYIAGKDVVGQAYKVDAALLKKFEIDNDVFIAEFDLSALSDLSRQIEPLVYEPVPRFPSFEFDLALSVDKRINAGEMESAIKKSAGKLLADISVFDVFEGKPLDANQKSVAYRLSFVDRERTLTIKDVEPVVNKIVKTLEKNFSAKLRS